MGDRIRTSMLRASGATREVSPPAVHGAPPAPPGGGGRRVAAERATSGAGRDPADRRDPVVTEGLGRPGPGPRLEAAWRAAGLTLPDLPRMRRYRVDRVLDQLRRRDLGGVLVSDPLNIRYATDTTNMQVWVMHNLNRSAWVGADGRVVLWEFAGCDFMADHSEVVDEVRPAMPATYFSAGSRHLEQARRWAEDLLEVIGPDVGRGDRIAIDRCHHAGYRLLESAGLGITSGEEVMERARLHKGPDELAAMRCAIHACQATMAEMRAALEPGMAEREVWALLHAGNIRRAGEWIETQLLSSGPRTNPWMQEASSRVIGNGDLVAYDTDLVGPYGMMVDISRTWIAGDRAATPAQRRVHGLAIEQLERNIPLLTPGRTFRGLAERSWFPPVEDWRHYSVLNHGVGLCDEYPEIYFPHEWDEWGDEGVLEPGMVLTVEAYVGSRHGGEGAKLEQQVLVTDHGPEVLSTFPLDLAP